VRQSLGLLAWVNILKVFTHFLDNSVTLFEPGKNAIASEGQHYTTLAAPELSAKIGQNTLDELVAEIELVQGASHPFDLKSFLAGEMTPVFFGSALNNFGIKALLDRFIDYAPPPQPRITQTRLVAPNEEKFAGFIFKIQANMDPAHRDRIAFLRICSGQYTKGMKMRHVRLNREVQIANALTFMAV
jgi:peptide chain release factor 3